MLKTSTPSPQRSLFFSLEDTLSQKHPLYILANKIDWVIFEREFSPLYCLDNGCPAKPIRLMVGLLILKHVRNLSDENLVEQWAENNYYQYFCGQQEFVAQPPCASSELVHFRKRIGEHGCELIFKESIRINGQDGKEPHVWADTTVQEKNITFPTDAKQHRRIIQKCKKIAKTYGVELRQTYTRILKELGVDQRFRNHPKNKHKARKADKRIKTIAGRLVRELERKLPDGHNCQPQLEIFKQVLSQTKDSKNKIYSLHEPEVQCISKGKEHKKYEFGNKVSILYTQNTGVIVGATSFRNPYDGNTLPTALDQYERLLDQPPKTVIADRGYKGKTAIGDTIIKNEFTPLLQIIFQHTKKSISYKHKQSVL